MILFVLGPSGVGKSSACDRTLAQYPHIKYVNLDKRVGLPNPGDIFWSRAKQILREIENQDSKSNLHQIFLVDVGAGTLESQGAYDYFYSKPCLIVLYDVAENVLKRLKENRPFDRWANASVAELEKVEYTSNRQRFYALGNRCNVMGLSEEEAGDKFLLVFGSVTGIARSSTV